MYEKYLGWFWMVTIFQVLKLQICYTIHPKAVVVRHVQKKISNCCLGTILEKWWGYWEVVGKDYKDVFVEAVKDAKEKPLTTGALASALALITSLVATNPDYISYRDTIIRYSIQVTS